MAGVLPDNKFEGPASAKEIQATANDAHIVHVAES